MGDRAETITAIDQRELAGYDRKFPWPTRPYVAGIEVTQSVQYFKASRHLTDPADRGPDNSISLAAYKPAWVRVYVRSGLLGAGTTMTGKLIVERRATELPFWGQVAEIAPRAPGTVAAQVSEAYAVERGALAATLDFILPSDVVAGQLRLTAVIWPQGGSDASPSDTEQVTVDASLLQTLRVRGIMVSYNGPDGSGTGSNLNLPAPTVSDLQASCGNTHTVYPVESTGVYSSGGSITWNTPLTGVATNPGGCSTQWLSLNVAIAQARANDGNRTDVLYVGLLPSGVPIANVGGCNSSGVSGVPNGAEWTMAHELGHAAGLVHAPCGTPGDPNYPAYEPYDPAGSPKASLGEYGLDINNGTIHPPAEKDFMSYCGPVWISLFHHGRLYDNAALHPRSLHFGPNIPVLYDPWLWPWEYIPDPPSWDLPSHFVKVAVQPVISLVGVVNLVGELEVSSVMRVMAVPKLQGAIPTNLVAELVGEAGQPLTRAVVMRTDAHGAGCGCGGDEHGGHDSPSSGYAFQVMLSNVAKGSSLRIVRVDPEGGGGEVKEVWRREPAGEPPRIRRVTARLEKKQVIIRWDVDEGRKVDYSLQFSKDKGRSWNGLAAGVRGTEYRVSPADLPSGAVIVRVLAHDGFHTAHADSKPLRLPPRPPVVSILHPQDGRRFAAGVSLRLFAAVGTHLGGRNPRLRLVWKVDGERVGEGAECWLHSPRPGRHECHVTAQDDGGESEARVVFVIEPARKKRDEP